MNPTASRAMISKFLTSYNSHHPTTGEGGGQIEHDGWGGGWRLTIRTLIVFNVWVCGEAYYNNNDDKDSILFTHFFFFFFRQVAAESHLGTLTFPRVCRQSCCTSSYTSATARTQTVRPAFLKLWILALME